jgi:integrase
LFHIVNKTNVKYLGIMYNKIKTKNRKVKLNMTTEKRGEKWYYRFSLDGKEYRKVTDATTKKEADKIEALAKAEIIKGRGKSLKSKMTFNDVCEKFLEYSKANKKSWRCDVSHMKRFKAHFQNKKLTDITVFDIESYKVKRLQMDISPNTINSELRVLNRIFTYSIENEWLENNPNRKVKKLKKKIRPERFVTKEEEEKLLSVDVGPKYDYIKNMITFAINTGCRKSEITSLTWQQINFRDRMISLYETKSNKPRKIPMNEEVYDLLIALYFGNNTGYVFKQKNGKKVGDFKIIFRNICKLAGVSGITFHMLRHTFCSRLMANGVNILIIQQLLGHASITTTALYAHSYKQQKVDAVNSLLQFNDSSYFKTSLSN